MTSDYASIDTGSLAPGAVPHKCRRSGLPGTYATPKVPKDQASYRIRQGFAAADRLTAHPPLEQPEKPVARVVVDVMLKPEILDPQGQAVLGALARLGHSDIASVRQGKRFEIELDAAPDAASLDEIASTLLANTVIEDYSIHVEES